MLNEKTVTLKNSKHEYFTQNKIACLIILR